MKKIMKLVVIAARGLKDPHLMSKVKPFTVVYVAGLLSDRPIKTPTNPGCNPVWSFQLEFELPQTKLQQNSLTLVFQIFSKNMLAIDREIGKVVVSVNELLDSSSGTGMSIITKTVPVITPSGEFQGELTFSYQFIDTDASEATVEDVGIHAPPTTEQNMGGGGGGGRSVSGMLARAIACGNIAAVVLSELL